MSDDKGSPQQAMILQGLRKHMRPVQALIMLSVYRQFYERCISPIYIVHKDCYFQFNVPQVMKAMKLKEPVVQLMLTKLVDEGWLERRKSKRGMEYRLVWGKIQPFMEAGAPKGDRLRNRE